MNGSRCMRWLLTAVIAIVFAASPLPVAMSAEDNVTAKPDQVTENDVLTPDEKSAAQETEPVTSDTASEQSAPIAVEKAEAQRVAPEDTPVGADASDEQAAPVAAEKGTAQSERTKGTGEQKRQDQINELQQQLGEQNRQLDAQRSVAAEQQKKLDGQQQALAQQQSQIETQTSILQAMQTRESETFS